MGGVIGAVSTKFVITAGALLLSARVGMHPVKAVLDPTIQTTLMTPKVAGIREGAIDGALIDSERWIGLDAHILRIRKFVISTSISVDSVLAVDVFKSAAFLLDFRSHHLDVLEAGQLRRATAGMKQVPIATSPDGCFTIAGVDEDGQSVSAALIARPQGDHIGTPKALRLGETRLAVSQPNQATCPASQMELGWSAFEGRRVVLDLEHDKIWFTPDGKGN